MIKDLYWIDVEDERDMKNQEPWDFGLSSWEVGINSYVSEEDLERDRFGRTKFCFR